LIPAVHSSIVIASSPYLPIHQGEGILQKTCDLGQKGAEKLIISPVVDTSGNPFT